MDILLAQPAHDLALVGGDLVIATLAQEIAQSIKIRLLTILGEWYLDDTIGFIDVINMTGAGQPVGVKASTSQARLDNMRNRLRDAVLTTPGVATIDRVTLGYQRSTRQVALTFAATAVTGDVITGTLGRSVQ